ncbi:MAG: leucine-rich repeat domain-containing protein, partial [Clostridia bacterium]|nr:leucine-rich repeat domain-containing protein [Clostridia bacterium]
MKNKFVALFIVLCFVISLFPVSSTASEITYGTYGIFEYSIYEGNVLLDGLNATATGDIVIPDEIEGCPVTQIPDYFFKDCTEMTSIYIPDSVYYIGAWAFSGCSAIEEIRLPASLEELLAGTFYECTSLKSVYIPKNVQSIYMNSFSFCPNIETIVVEEGNEFYYSKDNALIDQNKTLIRIGKNNSIPNDGSVTSLEGTFWGQTNLTEIVIPDCVTEIKYGAFSNCTALKKATLHNGITLIDACAFENC